MFTALDTSPKQTINNDQAIVKCPWSITHIWTTDMLLLDGVVMLTSKWNPHRLCLYWEGFHLHGLVLHAKIVWNHDELATLACVLHWCMSVIVALVGNTFSSPPYTSYASQRSGRDILLSNEDKQKRMCKDDIEENDIINSHNIQRRCTFIHNNQTWSITY